MRLWSGESQSNLFLQKQQKPNPILTNIFYLAIDSSQLSSQTQRDYWEWQWMLTQRIYWGINFHLQSNEFQSRLACQSSVGGLSFQNTRLTFTVRCNASHANLTLTHCHTLSPTLSLTVSLSHSLLRSWPYASSSWRGYEAVVPPSSSSCSGSWRWCVPWCPYGQRSSWLCTRYGGSRTLLYSLWSMGEVAGVMTQALTYSVSAWLILLISSQNYSHTLCECRLIETTVKTVMTHSNFVT